MIVDAIDPGLSATIIFFDLLRKLGGGETRIPSSALEVPHVTLRDYSQNPIPIGAQVNLTFRLEDESHHPSIY